VRRYLIIIFTIALIFLGNDLKAQDYIRSLGFRAGLSQGISYKQFYSTTDAIEGILSVRWRGFYVTGLWQRHAPAFDVRSLYWFYGGGAHAGFWDGSANPWFDDDRAVIGVDGIVGLEYVLDDIPINVAVDWKPAFNVIGYTGFWGDELGITVRFMF
jgi:hypothetical protein